MKLAELPAACIVGRPNVGKSTLFNRIIGRRRAVVYEASGTTRDRVEALYEKDRGSLRLIDTGGFIKTTRDKMSSMVKRQIEEAIKEADVLLFVCDAKTGVSPQDEEILPILRRCNKKVFLVVNKVDTKKMEDDIYDFYRFGLGNPYPVSAVHNRGVDKLIEDVLNSVSREEREREKIIYRIAITGKPNVGKSLFLNNLLKEQRVIVDDAPGTTRDSIDTYFKKGENLFLLIDTAGIRHKRKVKEAIDVYSMSRSREAIERSDASFLLIDGYDGLRNDDVKIFNFIIESGKCCVIVVNKWDLVKNIQMADYNNAILRKLPQAASYPIVFASAKTGRNVLSCIDMVKYVVANSSQNTSTKELNKFLSKIKNYPVPTKKKNPKFYYMVQIATRPPSFLIFVNDPRLVLGGYTNFIEGMLRKEFNFLGTPIRIVCRRKG